MNLGGLFNRILRLIATGRVARKGYLYRVAPLSNDTLILRPTPLDEAIGCKRTPIKTDDTASFLVIEVQEDQALWKQWVKVLFCRENEDTLIGWLPYHEFNRFILPEWES